MNRCVPLLRHNAQGTKLQALNARAYKANQLCSADITIDAGTGKETEK